MPVLLVLLLLLALPAAAQSPIPTLLLDEQPVGEPSIRSIGGGFPDAIATDGTNFLIVSTSVVKLYSYGQVAMLVDANAQPLLKRSIRLSGGGEYAAEAAWSGRVYLVVLGSYVGSVRGIRIDAAGNVLDPKPIEIHPAGALSGSALIEVVWDGGQFVVAHLVSGPKLIATRVSETGEILQNDIEIPGVLSLNVAARRGMTVFVWSDAAAMHSRTMNPAGVLGPTVDIPAIRDAPLVVTEDGFLQLVAVGSEIEAQHFGLNGQPDRAIERLPLNATAALRVVPSGTSFLLLARPTPDAPYRAVHIDSSGEMLDAPREVPGFEGLVASTGDKTLVTWPVADGPPGYTPSATVARPLESTEPVRIHREYAAQGSPRVSWQGLQPIVSWNENAPHAKAIGSTTVTQPGGDGGFEVAMASSPSATLHVLLRGSFGLAAAVGERDSVVIDSERVNSQFVRAVWTGRDFMIVWAREPRSTLAVDIVGARVSSDGALIDGPHVIGNAGQLLDVAIGASASQVLVVYQSGGVARAVRLDANGAWPAEDITTPADQQYLANPFSVASDGVNFFISWINRGNREPNDWIGGRLFDPNGRGLIPLTQYSSGGDTKQLMVAFWTGSNYLIVWSQLYPPSTLFAARASADGRLLDYPPVRIGTIDGVVTSLSRGPGGQIAVAYTRNLRVYTRLIVPARQHSVSHR